MIETCLKKFKVAVEVANFICYVKYVNQANDAITQNFIDTLYELINSKANINKKDIEDFMSLHKYQLRPNMLQEQKFSLPYNPISDKYLKSQENINDSYDTQFLIKTINNIETYFNKNTFMNHFTDMYQNSLFLLDIRYYGMEKKYYEVDFELYLTENKLYLKSSDDKLVTSLLEQYDLEEIIQTLDLRQELDYQHVIAPDNIKNGMLNSIYPFNKESILEQLVDNYETSNCMFINNVFLNAIDVSYMDLIKALEIPKLLIVLERQEYSYFNQHKNNHINRIEKIDNNTIIHIDEHLFREAIGNMGYIIMMNESNNVVLSQLDPDYGKFPYIGVMKNKDLSLFKNILDKFFEIKKLDSYMDNLLLLTFVLNEEVINSNLNYFLVNTLKTKSSFLRMNLDSRESLPFTDLKKLVQIYYLAQKLQKKISINPQNVKLLLNDMLNMIRKINDYDRWNEYKSIMNEVLQIFNIDVEMYETEITRIEVLLDIKRTIFEKDKDISFILDTSVLMDEPDIFNKYFNNSSIVVHSIIQDELENYRGTDINAVRAMRNINYLRNNPKAQMQFIRGEKGDTKFTKLLKVKVFEDLMKQLNNEGKYPVIVSNDNELVLFQKNKANIIQLDHIPLLY
jgi:hypothetical protein